MKNEFGILKKSDRAIEAENSGCVPYSHLSAWQKRAVDCGAVHSCEWHHTGATANITYYYYLEAFEDLNPSDFPPGKVEKVKQADLSRLKIVIEYEEMVGGYSRGARKKFEERKVEGLDVRKKDNVITGAGGRRLTSRNKSVKFFYRGYKCRKFKELARKEVVELGYKLI